MATSARTASPGGSALAKKLIGIYFTLFQLILEGKVGHAHELKASMEAQQAAKGKGKGGTKKGHKKQRWKPRPGGGKGPEGGGKPGKATAQPGAPQPSSQVGSLSLQVPCDFASGKSFCLCPEIVHTPAGRWEKREVVVQQQP